MNRLGDGAIVESQQSAESFHAPDRADIGTVWLGGLDQSVVESLMIPLRVIVSGVFQGCFAKRPFAEEKHSTETLVLDRPDEPLGIGVQVGRAWRQSDDLDAGIVQEIPEIRRELRITVEDQELLLCEETVDRVGDVPMGCSW